MDQEIGIWPPNEVFYVQSMLTITQNAMLNLTQLSHCLDEEVAENEYNEAQILDSIQNLISNAGAISRYFWPSRKDPLHQTRALALRKAYQINEQNPLKNRDIRNFVEHFDENLDKFLAKMLAGTIIPSYVGERPLNEQVPLKFFRAYFPHEIIFCALDMEYNIDSLVKELIRLHRLFNEASKHGGRLPA